jgi:hypothetical protein
MSASDQFLFSAQCGLTVTERSFNFSFVTLFAFWLENPQNGQQVSSELPRGMRGCHQQADQLGVARRQLLPGAGKFNEIRRKSVV